MSTKIFSHTTLENKMTNFDLSNLNTILTNHNDPISKPYFYKHKTSGSNIFRCECCDYETNLFMTATSKRENKKEQYFEYNSMVKNIHGIKTHMLSYEHRFNEYYSKGLIPVIPEFDGDLMNNTFTFFKDHITSVADDEGMFWCDLCDVSFKTRKQLYTHLVKNNKKHLVRQVEKDNTAPFKVSVMDNTYDIEYFFKKSQITPTDRLKMEKYKDGDSYYCGHCYFKPEDEDDFYKHLTSKRHKRCKILDVNKEIYKINDVDKIFCNTCNCDVDDLLKHDASH